MAGCGRRSKRKRSSRFVKDTTVCLCDLPDAILIHILSFLPTKLVVSTSVLSRRWRYLWTSTPNLQLHEYDFKYDHDKFMTFAERALFLRGGSSLVSLSLSCSVKNDESRINAWITSAIQHKVEQLSLHLDGYADSFFLPYCIFGCQSLVKLDIPMRICIRVPSMICLHRLKHLSLRAVEFADSESAERLLSHPMLEELLLCNCNWDNITTVNVNSPKLQSLAIKDEVEQDLPEERQVCFFGDNLKIFRYEGFLPPTQYYICGSTMQLREAVILVEYHGEEVQYTHGPSNRYCKLVNSLSEVQNLTLSEETAQSFYLLNQCPWIQTSLPVFDRVTQLNLNGGDTIGHITLVRECLKMLFKRCPHLEHLNFTSMISLDFRAQVSRPMPSCFRTHLKKVTLQICECDLIHSYIYRDAINLLFNSAPVLEEMVIHCIKDSLIPGRVPKAEKLERMLNAHPKVSKNCKVSVVVVV